MNPHLLLRWAFGASLLASGVLVGHASAQTRASALTGRESIDLVTGPVLGSGRIVGLGGAYAALAVGSDGAAWTPAAYATRSLWDLSWFELDVALDYSPAVFRNLVFHGIADSHLLSSSNLATIGARFEFAGFGIGALLREQFYDLSGGAQLQLSLANAGAAYAFMEGQLVVGLAARIAAMSVSDLTPDRAAIDFFGAGPEVGAIFGPADQPYRIGLSARLSVHAARTSGAPITSELTLPRRLVLPAEAQLGFVYQLGPRPLNQRFIDPRRVNKRLFDAMLARREQRRRDELKREQAAGRSRAPSDEPSDAAWLQQETLTRAAEERELQHAIEAAAAARENAVKRLSRRYLLLSAEAIWLAATDNGIGIESFLVQEAQVSGRSPSLGLRVGAEGEPIPGWVILRLGSYLEPSRFAGVGYRVHATFGNDVRLFSWDLFGLLDEFTLRAGVYADVAHHYQAVGFSAGMWH